MTFWGRKIVAGLVVAGLVAAVLLAFSPVVSAVAETEKPDPTPSVTSKKQRDSVPSQSSSSSLDPTSLSSSDPSTSTEGEVDSPDTLEDLPDIAPDDTRTFIAIGIAIVVALVAGVVVFFIKK